MHGPRTLRSRIFSWFVGAIVLATLTSALVVSHTRPETLVGAESVATHVSDELARTWDDPPAMRAYVDEVRDVTGFDVRVTRDLRRVPPRVRHLAEHGASFVPEGPQHVVIPVRRAGQLLGTVDIEGMSARGGAWPWWRFVLALGLVLAVLSAMAGGVANQLARPLERLARAADRFGGGDLAFRTEVAGGRHRWVAREVRDVAVSFNRMADRVEAMVRGQRELLGAISHELRSPLGRARVALEIARDRLPPPPPRSQAEPPPPERSPAAPPERSPAAPPERSPAAPPERSPAAALDDVDAQLGAIDSILGDLLDVTRAGLADLRTETLDLVGWLRAVVAEEPTVPEITLDLSSASDAVPATFDAALLRRAVHNLLVNARAHGHPEGQPLEVRVETFRRAGAASAEITVRDRGPGFAPGFEARAFDAFVRGDAARARPTAGAGYGLGLAIVRRVVEAHGGHVFARNAPGGGAEVGFDLPIGPRSR